MEEETRVETLTAALVYLLAHYARTGHMQELALHPDAAPVLRDVRAGLHGVWLSGGHEPRH